MALWSSDLSTQDSAESATSVAGLACLIMAGFCLLSLVLLALASGGEASNLLFIGLASAVVELAIFLVAALRFRAGKGLVWGSVAVLVLVLEILTKLITVSVPGLIINSIALIVIINGIRGAQAMRRGFQDPDVQAEIFS